MPRIRGLSDARRKKLVKALKEFSDPDDWKKIFTIASTKGFTGKDGREFIPNWDYVFRNENYIKFFEEYEQENNTTQTREQLESEVLNSMLSE